MAGRNIEIFHMDKIRFSKLPLFTYYFYIQTNICLDGCLRYLENHNSSIEKKGGEGGGGIFIYDYCHP